MRQENFSIDQDNLVRAVVPARGEPYEHACSRDTYEATLHAINEATGPFTYEDIQKVTDKPYSQVATAIAFLKERGCIIPGRFRRHVPATGDTYLDGMIEWAALEHTEAHAIKEHQHGSWADGPYGRIK